MQQIEWEIIPMPLWMGTGLNRVLDVGPTYLLHENPSRCKFGDTATKLNYALQRLHHIGGSSRS
jgi:hypothetical protein